MNARTLVRTWRTGVPAAAITAMRYRFVRLSAFGMMFLGLAALTVSPICSGAPQTLPALFRPTIVDHGVALAAQGRWELPAYGMLFDFRSEAVDVYDRAGGLCWLDSEHIGTQSVKDLVPFFAEDSSPATITFAASPDGTQYRADSMASLPEACTKRLDRTAPSYVFEAVTASLAELYPFANEHHVDWAARAARLHPRVASIRSDGQLRAVLAELFRGVDDPHTSISGELDGRQFRIRTFRGRDFRELGAAFARQHRHALFLDWFFESWMPGEYDQAVAALLPGTCRQALGRGLVWGRLEGNVGYLAINRMMDFGTDSDVAADRALLAPALDQAMSDLKDTRALVLDVSHDLGGNDEVAADVAARFADRVRPAYSKQAFRGGQVQRFETIPREGARYLKPVYLLTSELTASAAEVFVMRMRELPNVTQVGEPTQGVFSDATEKGLPNGWILSMSTELYRDAEGRNHEGVGLMPDVRHRVIWPDHAGHRYRNAIQKAGALARSRS